MVCQQAPGGEAPAGRGKRGPASSSPFLMYSGIASAAGKAPLTIKVDVDDEAERVALHGDRQAAVQDIDGSSRSFRSWPRPAPWNSSQRANDGNLRPLVHQRSRRACATRRKNSSGCSRIINLTSEQASEAFRERTDPRLHDQTLAQFIRRPKWKPFVLTTSKS